MECGEKEKKKKKEKWRQQWKLAFLVQLATLDFLNYLYVRCIGKDIKLIFRANQGRIYRKSEWGCMKAPFWIKSWTVFQLIIF